MALTPQQVFRKYVVDGVPESGDHKPRKEDIPPLFFADVFLNRIEQIPEGRILGRAIGSGTGRPVALTGAQVAAMVGGGSSAGTAILSPRMFGAVGNGDPANSAADTAGFKAALNKLLTDAPGALPNLPGQYATLDLQGGSYILDSGYVATSGMHNAARIRITNGLLQFKDNVAVGTQYFIDLSAIGMLYGVQFDSLWLNGFKSDNSIIAKGGIKLPNTRVCKISNCFINGFTEKGIHGTNADFGQAINIEFCHIQGAIGNGTPAGNIGVHLLGGDNKIFGCYIGECTTLVKFGKGSNSIALCHLFNFTYASIAGIVCDEADKMMITDNYIDSVRVELHGFANGAPSHFWGNNIVGNKFYVPPNFVNAAAPLFSASTAAIVYIPKNAASIVDNDLIVANTFTCENGNFPPTIAVNTGSGNITTVSQTKINTDTAYGWTEKTTDPIFTLRFNNTISVSKNISSMIPFGSVRWLRAYVVEGASYTSDNFMFTPQTGDNVTTCYTAAARTCRVRVTASINIAPAD